MYNLILIHVLLFITNDSMLWCSLVFYIITLSQVPILAHLLFRVVTLEVYIVGFAQFLLSHRQILNLAQLDKILSYTKL